MACWCDGKTEPEMIPLDQCGNEALATYCFECGRDLRLPMASGEDQIIERGRFELREEDGRRFWFGGEEGWKDATEVGEDGVLIMSADHFPVGTVLEFTGPVTVSPTEPTEPREGEDA